MMFPSPVTGRLYGPDCLGRLHKNLLKKAGITDNIPFHGLRHTCATIFAKDRPFIGNLSSIFLLFVVDTYNFSPAWLYKNNKKLLLVCV